MANQIRYQVGFDIQQGNLNQLKSSTPKYITNIRKTDEEKERDIYIYY